MMRRTMIIAGVLTSAQTAIGVNAFRMLRGADGENCENGHRCSGNNKNASVSPAYDSTQTKNHHQHHSHHDEAANAAANFGDAANLSAANYDASNDAKHKEHEPQGYAAAAMNVASETAQKVGSAMGSTAATAMKGAQTIGNYMGSAIAAPMNAVSASMDSTITKVPTVSTMFQAVGLGGPFDRMRDFYDRFIGRKSLFKQCLIFGLMGVVFGLVLPRAFKVFAGCLSVSQRYINWFSYCFMFLPYCLCCCIRDSWKKSWKTVCATNCCYSCGLLSSKQVRTDLRGQVARTQMVHSITSSIFNTIGSNVYSGLMSHRCP